MSAAEFSILRRLCKDGIPHRFAATNLIRFTSITHLRLDKTSIVRQRQRRVARLAHRETVGKRE
jgi:hypothetical protein